MRKLGRGWKGKEKDRKKVEGKEWKRTEGERENDTKKVEGEGEQ